ncbi:hypothetical protein BX666DRAFT_2030489 [Dichotomocladium elegans]|nr:hypothetical protein BX666DRAFT_2030489 [Dichotomocladium elegans]
MTCILHQRNYNHPPLYTQYDGCSPGLSNPHDLYHQALSLLGNNCTERELVSFPTATILRLTAYGITETAMHGRQGTHWVGHPIMRFVHPRHVQRLCGGVSEASKSGRPVAIPFIPCMLDPLSATAATCHIVIHPANTLQDNKDSDYYCVLFSEQRDRPIAVATFLLLVRQAAAWLSASPFRLLVWLVTILFLQKKKEA